MRVKLSLGCILNDGFSYGYGYITVSFYTSALSLQPIAIAVAKMLNSDTVFDYSNDITYTKGRRVWYSICLQLKTPLEPWRLLGTRLPSFARVRVITNNWLQWILSTFSIWIRKPPKEKLDLFWYGKTKLLIVVHKCYNRPMKGKRESSLDEIRPGVINIPIRSCHVGLSAIFCQCWFRNEDEGIIYHLEIVYNAVIVNQIS